MPSGLVSVSGIPGCAGVVAQQRDRVGQRRSRPCRTSARGRRCCARRRRGSRPRDATSSPPRSTSAASSNGSTSRGQPSRLSATSGVPPIAYTSERALAAAIRPQSYGVVDDRGEEVRGRDHGRPAGRCGPRPRRRRCPGRPAARRRGSAGRPSRPATASSSSPGGILQAQPPPCAYDVSRSMPLSCPRRRTGAWWPPRSSKSLWPAQRVRGVRFPSASATPIDLSRVSGQVWEGSGAAGRPLAEGVSAWPGTRRSPIRGTGRVEVQEIDYPTLELKDGPGVNPANIGRKLPHGVILKSVATNICGSDQHMVRGRTTAPEGLVLGHEITGEVVEAGPGVEFIKVGDLVLGAVQHRLRPVPQLQGGQDRHLPERQPRPPRLRVRLCGHGRLGRRPGRVRHGAVRRLEPAEVPRQGPGDGEDPRPGDAVGHLPDRLPRLRQRRRDHRLDRLYRRRRSGRARRGAVGLPARGRGRHRRRPQRRPAGAGAQLRLRDRRRLPGRTGGPDRADPGRARGRLRRRRGRLRGPRARRTTRAPSSRPRCSTR